MSDKITVYEKPTCTKCREMDRFLRESNVDFSKINYYLEPLGEKKLRALIKKIGIKPRELLQLRHLKKGKQAQRLVHIKDARPHFLQDSP